MKKDLHRLLNAIAKAGWGVELRKGGHYCLTSPSGQLIFASSTPSSRRSLLNLKARIRKAA